MIRAYCIFCAVFALGAATVAAEEPSAQAEEYLDILEERASTSPARVVRFREARYFPFRSKAVELEGVARVDAARGTSVEYPEKKVAIIADEQGMLLRRYSSDGSFKDRPLPKQQGEAGELLAVLFQFDKRSLLEAFRVDTTQENGSWSLLLYPKDGDSSKLAGVKVQSDDERLQLIDIRLEGNRAFQIAPVEEQERESFSPEELNRYFR